MARIKITDLPKDAKISAKDMRMIHGGPTAVEYAVMLSRRVPPGTYDPRFPTSASLLGDALPAPNPINPGPPG